LSPQADRIRGQVRAAAGGALAQLPLDGGVVDIVVRHDPRTVIAEVGIGGFAPDGHTVFVALDPDHDRFEVALERELFATLAHELHHVARHRAGVRGHTLFDAIVSEGLADHFSIEVTRADAPPWLSRSRPSRPLRWPQGHAKSGTTAAITTLPGSSVAMSSTSRAGRDTRLAFSS